MGSPFRPFKNDNIPIIGRAFSVKSGFSTVVVQCGCGAYEPVLLVGANPAPCPACKKVYQLGEFKFDAQTGQINTKIGIHPATQPHEPEPAGLVS